MLESKIADFGHTSFNATSDKNGLVRLVIQYNSENGGILSGAEVKELYEWLGTMALFTVPAPIQTALGISVPSNNFAHTARRLDGSISDAMSIAGRPDPLKQLGVAEVFEK